jgi:hypothetical protein
MGEVSAREKSVVVQGLTKYTKVLRCVVQGGR